MSSVLRHFALNADDVQRAKSFYETVFGWNFTPYGPPNFYQIVNAGDGIIGALQERRELLKSKPMFGFENTFGVEDIQATLEAVTEAGGRTLMEPYFIEGVGDIAYFEDSEGNVCGIGQYLPGIWT